MPCEVGGAGAQLSVGIVGVAVLAVWAELVPVRDVPVRHRDRLARNVGEVPSGPIHPERPEDVPLAPRVEGDARRDLHQVGGERDAHVAVVVPGPRRIRIEVPIGVVMPPALREVVAHGVPEWDGGVSAHVGRREDAPVVAEPSRMREQHPGRDHAGGMRRALDAERQDLVHVRVEVDQASLHRLHRGRRDDRLGDRREHVDRVRRRLPVVLEVRPSERMGPEHALIADDARGDGGHPRLGHLRADVRVEVLSGARVGPCSGERDRGSRSGRRSEEATARKRSVRVHRRMVVSRASGNESRRG